MPESLKQRMYVVNIETYKRGMVIYSAGNNAVDSVYHIVVLEEAAEMTFVTLRLIPKSPWRSMCWISITRANMVVIPIMGKTKWMKKFMNEYSAKTTIYTSRCEILGCVVCHQSFMGVSYITDPLFTTQQMS